MQYPSRMSTMPILVSGILYWSPRQVYALPFHSINIVSTLWIFLRVFSLSQLEISRSLFSLIFLYINWTFFLISHSSKSSTSSLWWLHHVAVTEIYRSNVELTFFVLQYFSQRYFRDFYYGAKLTVLNFFHIDFAFPPFASPFVSYFLPTYPAI